MSTPRFAWLSMVLLLLSLIVLPAGADEEEVLTVYSGRNESLVGPILAQFTEDTGIAVEVLVWRHERSRQSDPH